MAETNPCSRCGDPVRATRPSKSGKHYCRKRLCQNERIKLHRQTASKKTLTAHEERIAELEQTLADEVNLVWKILQGDAGRVECKECGLLNAIPGFAHPNAEAMACYGVGGEQTKLQRAMGRVIWPPENRPRREA